MIESITIKNVATFDPKNGVQITGLKKVNFIYGANGCGKIINKYFVVFEDIFKYTKNIGHYNMMMGKNSESE